MKCFTAHNSRTAARASTAAGSRSRVAVARCQASAHSLPQTIAAVAASTLLVASPAFAELTPVDLASKSLESEYARIIEQRTGKSSALPELTSAPEVAAPKQAEYVKPKAIKVEKLEVVQAPEVAMPVPAALPSTPASAPVAAPAPAPIPATAAAPAPAAASAPVPEAVSAPKRSAPVAAQAAKPAPAAVKAVVPAEKPAPALQAVVPAPATEQPKTTTSPAILVGAVAVLALIAVGASGKGQEQPAASTPAAPAAAVPAAPAAAAGAGTAAEATSSEQPPSASS